MKKLIGFIIMSLLIVACATVPIQNPVCPQEGSWICEKSAELGVQPEEVYGWIYDTIAIAAISDVVKLKEVCKFEQEIADWYVRMYPISYDAFITEMFSKISELDPQKMILIKNIINRRLVAYRSPALISEVDDIILRKGHVAFQRDMMCY